MLHQLHKNIDKKYERVDLRTSFAAKDLLRKAAEYYGLSLSAFVLSASLETAREILNEQERLTLSDKDRDLLLKHLDSPPSPSKTLKKAMQDYININGTSE